MEFCTWRPRVFRFGRLFQKLSQSQGIMAQLKDLGWHGLSTVHLADEEHLLGRTPF